MAETGRKIEVRYGAFACRVEGYDDPVRQLRDVLSLMQRVIAETPALAEHAPELGHAQLGRIREVLDGGRAADDSPGLVIVRSGEPSSDRASDAEILPDDPASEPRPGLDPTSPDPGPHPSAALYSAPAAAIAEAAFAAGIASEDASQAGDADRVQWPGGAGEAHQAQGPLGTERPDQAQGPLGAGQPDQAQGPLGADDADQPASAAALFAAPAAGIAEKVFPIGLDASAAPADPDDDAGDADRSSPGEAPERRAQTGAEVLTGAPGGPGEGWAPWSPGPAIGTDGPSGQAPGTGRPDFAAPQTDDPPADRQLREPAAHFDAAGREDEPVPVVNIFAPPPAEAHAPDPSEPHESPADRHSSTGPGPVPSLLRETGPAAADPESPRQSGGPAEWRDREAPRGEDPDADDLDEASEGPAGEWREPEGEPSAENRLAALITRYQSSVLGGSDHQPAPEGNRPGAPSAAELAERSEATEVHDLLAASAAWLTLAGGRARFTRREVMEVFETLPGDHPRTLEARIKGFGRLVRSGTLQLVDEGTFTLAPRERARFADLFRQG